MAYFVYMLRCGDGSLYTGSTNDVERRLMAHQRGRGAKFTRSRLRVELVYREEVQDRSAALRREAAVQGKLHENTLRIGCFASIARARLPQLLRKFRKIHPEIRVDVLVRGYELAAELEEGTIHLALVDEA